MMSVKVEYGISLAGCTLVKPCSCYVGVDWTFWLSVQPCRCYVGVVWTVWLFVKPCPCNVAVVWSLWLFITPSYFIAFLHSYVQLFALRCHFSVCCLFRLLSLWCLFLAQSLRVLLRAAFTCSSLSLFGLLFASVTPLFLAVLVVLVTCSVLASPFEGCFHLLFTVFVWFPLLNLAPWRGSPFRCFGSPVPLQLSGSQLYRLRHYTLK